MVLTIPLGTKRRLTFAWTRRGGMSAATWRKDFPSDPPHGDDEGGAGVREPLRPVRPSGTGSVALPLDE
jgi:hypothetical protein